MNYRYVQGEIVNTYDILEIKTGYKVKHNIPQALAKELTRKLNFGSGFDGWTPEFFLNEFNLPHENEII